MDQDNHQIRRCCIANDNGQRIENKKAEDTNDMTENNIKENIILKKIKDFYFINKSKINSISKKIAKNVKQSAQNIFKNDIFEEVNSNLKSGVVATVVVCIFVCVATAFFAPAYDVYLDGEKIGVVSNTDDFDAMLLSANNTIASIAGEYDRIYSVPVYIFRIIPKVSFTSHEELKRNIISLSSAVSQGYTIVADGNPVVSLKEKAEAEAVINGTKQIYSYEEAEIINNIEIVPEFISINNLSDKESALEKLKPVVSVKTTEVVTYVAEVPFEVQNIQTDELYEGDKKIQQEGTVGSKSVTAKITKINGVETEADILSSDEINSPVKEVVMVGIKEKPNGIGSGNFIQPFYGTITSRFGPRWGRTHKGIDIAGEIGSPIKAADNGEVTLSEFKSDYGNLVILDHNNGFQTYYAHLDSMDVKVGDKVEKDQIIGKLGTTGYSTGPHLHFEVRKNGEPCNPGVYLENLR